MKVYVALYCSSTEDVETKICLGGFSTRKNAEDVLIDRFRKDMIDYYNSPSDYRLDIFDEKMLKYYKTISPDELLDELNKYGNYTIIELNTDEIVEKVFELD
jgi:esterase/lipase superfamily enzyme